MAGSIPALLLERARATPGAEALRHRDGTRGAGGWVSLTWSRIADRVRELATGLRTLGVGDEARVAILSGTRTEWLLADLAILAAGGATTTIYPSNTGRECAYVIADSGSVLVVAEDDTQVAKLRAVRDTIPDVRHVVVIDGRSGDDGWVLTLAEVAARGRDLDDPAAYEDRIAALSPDRLATVIYTSGATGRPKGVELTHDNWLYEAHAVASLGILRPDDLHFLWLPLSHSFGKVLEVAMIATGVPTAVDGRVDRIAENLVELRPTIVAAAPRVFEKIHNTVTASVGDSGPRAALFRWARGIGLAVSRLRREGRRPTWGLRARYAVADRLVFARLRARLGGRIRFLVSGSAPLSPPVAEFFDAAGLTILEGYGLTESTAGSFLNRPGSVRIGTVGPPLPGTEVRIAGDGEILLRGRGVMRGYHNLPEETAATLVDGWLHTGDIGELDAAGRLRITDRKKDLIKTSNGKYVAPQELEGRLKAACPYLSHVLVHGDRRSFCTALVTLDPDTIVPWARDRGLGTDPVELAARPEVHALVDAAVRAVNADLARHETIKTFAVLPRDFTVESGELTASLKPRRRVIEERHRDVLDSLYRTR